MKTIINISSDKVSLFGGNETLLLERNCVDRNIGEILVAQDKTYHFSEYIVINGPGGFTNLRVGCLALNLLKTLKKDQISFFTISKIELFKIFYQKGWLPRYGVIYIGQKSNLWIWDFEENKKVTTIKKSEIENVSSDFGDFFIDEVYDTSYFGENEAQISCNFDQKSCILSFKNMQYSLEIDKLKLHPVEKLEPNYMIEPNIS